MLISSYFIILDTFAYYVFCLQFFSKKITIENKYIIKGTSAVSSSREPNKEKRREKRKGKLTCQIPTLHIFFFNTTDEGSDS